MTSLCLFSELCLLKIVCFEYEQKKQWLIVKAREKQHTEKQKTPKPYENFLRFLNKM